MQRRSFLHTTTAAALGLGLTGLNCQRKLDAEVLILGAGLAGLYAAQLLEAQGVEYQIIEASQRLGGRVHTIRDIAPSAEVGAVEIGDGYQRLLSIANKLNLPIEDSPPFPRDLLLHVNGLNIATTDWPTHVANELPGNLRDTPPYFLESKALRSQLPYKTLTDWYGVDYHSWDRPLQEVLQEKGYSEEAIRLTNANGNYNDISTVSTTQALRSMAYRQLGGSRKTVRISGGNAQLPEAMAASLNQTIAFGQAAISITEEQGSVGVLTAKNIHYRAKRLICTLPFSVLRTLQLNTNLPSTQVQAIQSLQYTDIAIAIVKVHVPFWEQDGLPITMWTDTPIGRVFPLTGADGQVHQLKVFINGQEAIAFASLPTAQQEQFILDQLTQLRPAAKGKITVQHVFSWGKHPFALGAYAEFQAGQVQAFVPVMAKPSRRIHFAGEHTSFEHKGMEGALASAERVVAEIIQQRQAITS